MPDTTQNPPTPPPGNDDDSPRPSPGEFSKETMLSLQLADQVGTASNAPGRPGLFATVNPELTPVYIIEFRDLILSARQIAGGGWTETVRHGVITQQEKKAGKDLAAALQDVQGMAKIAYEDTEPAKLDAYFIGGPALYASRRRLDECTTAILEQLNKEPLPGDLTARKATLVTLLKKFRDVQGTQTQAQSGATASRAELEGLMKEINARRRKLQLAADILWPPSPDNRGIRREFRLPLDRRLA